MTDRGSPGADAARPAAECPTAFEEQLLSGFLDGALTQAEAQRVRLHLEDCAPCRRQYQEMKTLREATLSTRFVIPPDDQWREIPRGGPSRVLRGGGWILLLVWAAVTGAFVLWQLATASVGVVEKSLVFTGLSGMGMLFVSILLDRLKSYKSDRYTRVEK